MQGRLADKNLETNIAGLISLRTVLTAGSKRLAVCKDPVSKNLIRVDRLATILDTLLLGLRSVLGDNEETSAITQELSEIMYRDIEELMEWVQTPIYSPEHPVGKQLMSEAKSDFIDKSTQ